MLSDCHDSSLPLSHTHTQILAHSRQFMGPRELADFVAKISRMIRYAGLRVDKSLGLTEGAAHQAELRVADASAALSSDVIKELELRPSLCSAQEAKLIEALDNLKRVAERVLDAMDAQREKLTALAISASRTADALRRDAEKLSGRRSARTSIRHIPASAANDTECARG